MRKAPYLILAPPYRDDSAGIRMLYALRDRLAAAGYQATIVQGGTAPPDAVVIYPETAPGNPLGGKTVVRYILNHPGSYGIPMGDAPGDLRWTCNRDALRPYVADDDHVLCVPILEDCFHDAGLPRSGAWVYVGKGSSANRLPITDGLPELTGKTRAEVARILQTAEILYTYDGFSMVVHEAKACGCPVVVLAGETDTIPYADHVADFPAQLARFIAETQAAADRVPDLRIAFGVMVSDWIRLDMVLRQSEIAGEMHFIKSPASATVGLNTLLDRIEAGGADVAVLCHQDMYFRQGWLAQVRAQLALLPASWIVAGIIGKDSQGRICGRFRDMRVPLVFDTSALHTFPHPAVCFDECCILVNLRTGFRFDETLAGFDLYGTLAVLQAWEMSGTAWILDAPAEHYCLRPFTWEPDEDFKRRFQWLYARFERLGRRIDTTAVGVETEQDRIFATSAG